MNKGVDLEKLREIPDPFAEQVAQSPRAAAPSRREASPTRGEVRLFRLAAAVAVVLYDVAWPALMERRPDLGTVPSSQLALQVAAPLLAAALAFGAVGRPTGLAFGEPKGRMLALVLSAPALFACATLMSAPAQHDPLFWRHVLGCFVVTVMLAAGPVTLGVLSFRNTFASLSAWRAAALGVASGGLACATMTFVCPNGDAAHILLGHGGILVLAGVIGALLRRIVRA
jgi:hypothetical protein